LPATSAVLAQALLSHDSWWVMKMHWLRTFPVMGTYKQWSSRKCSPCHAMIGAQAPGGAVVGSLCLT
jgi:hypothetical protein